MEELPSHVAPQGQDPVYLACSDVPGKGKLSQHRIILVWGMECWGNDNIFVLLKFLRRTTVHSRIVFVGR